MRITFVSPSAYPTLVPSEIAFAGGAELQQVLLARSLAERGHDVSFVVGDFGQEKVVDATGITVHRSFKLFEGHRKLRFVPDMMKLRAALRRSRPELVYQRSTAFYTGQTCLFSHQLGAAFVFALGIDYNAHRDLMGRVPRVVRSWYTWGVEHAELVLAQTEDQRTLMAQNYNCQPIVLANMLEIPSHSSSGSDCEDILWVGSMARRKRPELFVDLARSMPQLRFRMVGGPGEDEGYDLFVKGLAAGVPNLQVSGFVPQNEMESVYRRARILVNTSTLEGLPNTFLHAWSLGVPVLTISVDPDGVIAEKGLGLVAGEADGLRSCLKSLVDRDLEYARMALACKRHVAQNHDIAVLSETAERLFEAAITA